MIHLFQRFIANVDKEYRSILCLNGTLPDRSFFNISLPVIAVDGAANFLDKEGIDMHSIIGDLDSVDLSLCSKYNFIHLPDQNSSDFEKAIQYLRSKELLPSIILGMNGGYIDHILNNINIFLDSDSIFFDPPIVGYVLKASDESNFILPIKSKLSLMGMPYASVSTSGLQWELQKADLTFQGSNSCFNRTKEEEISISVHNGTALVMIYLQEIQDAGVTRN